MMRRAAVLVAIVTLVASGLLALAWSQQRRLLYFPSPGPVPPAAELLPNGRDVTFETDDGIRLGASYFPIADSGVAVLMCHGNAGDRADRVELAAALNEVGLSVLLFDYRGFGGNPGRPTEDGLAADARAAQAWLAAQPDVDRIVYFGESLGAAVAVGLAVERPPAALILRSPFTSLADVAGFLYPWLPRWLLIESYPSLDRIGDIHVPVMVIAGDRDSTVPASMSRRLHGAANDPKKFVLVLGAGHNDRQLLDGRQMIGDIQGFLSSTGVT
jgi:fermentation-respiration switch protein FrsA (DUF1100 family)